MKKAFLILTAALGLTMSAYAGNYYGSDSNGRTWYGNSDNNGNYYGSDSNGNTWYGHTDNSGNYYGSDSNGNTWYGNSNPN
jgi:hypothetical protein